MSEDFSKAAAALDTLDSFIAYCEATDESEWQVETVRNTGNTKNCLFGHLVNWHHGKDYQGSISGVWDYFEEAWSTTYYVYDVNDGRNHEYPQPTPKQRCISLLRDLNTGKTMRTYEAMEADAAKYADSR